MQGNNFREQLASKQLGGITKMYNFTSDNHKHYRCCRGELADRLEKSPEWFIMFMFENQKFQFKN